MVHENWILDQILAFSIIENLYHENRKRLIINLRKKNVQNDEFYMPAKFHAN